MSSQISIQNSSQSPLNQLDQTITASRQYMMNQRHPDGYWWYTLEANDTINAEYIMLLHYLGISDPRTEQAIARWIVRNQLNDGSWNLYFGGPGDLSTTVECYFALKLSGMDIDSEPMKKARHYIHQNGGISKVRVFTRIHLAIMGLVDWKICPNMPVALMAFPDWTPVNIYEFSSWARACIVPLLVIMDQRKACQLDIDLNELYVEDDPSQAKWVYPNDKGKMSLENAFIQIDRALKVADRMKLKPMRKASLKKCEEYVREHLPGTEDIFPAMFYGLLALKSLGYGLDDKGVQQALKGLKSFQMVVSHNNETGEIPVVPDSKESKGLSDDVIYQQCCVSPVWDTAWAGVALLEGGEDRSHPQLLETAEWLLSKQVRDVVGDWGIKNPGVKPGGWSFEFINEFYPDLDDTIEVMTFLHNTDLPYRKLKEPIERGINWLASMQCKNGGFAAFDKDQNKVVLNKIPFSDHGACLDPATVDMTGRAICFFVGVMDYDPQCPMIQRAADFILRNQDKNGAFEGRWGVNYLYGTWCALESMGLLKREKDQLALSRAIHWIKSVQNDDGGFGECCSSYDTNTYVSIDSVASQTAWALMGMIGAGEGKSDAARRAAEWLIKNQTSEGTWDERAYTGTGFPGHFYIRYHGYRNYFPLLALAKYRKAIS